VLRLGSLLVVLGLAACGSSPAGGDGGTGDGGLSCLEPDRVCPEEPPLPGSPCEGMLVCPYSGGGMGTCAGGVWAFDPGCDGGGGCAPPLAEICRTPFAGTLSGGSVEIGPPDGPFRPFTDHEVVSATFGGQGGAMIGYRVRVNGVEVPACMTVDAVVTYDGMAPVPSHRGIELHCGQTLSVYDILPDRPCEARIYPVTLTVEVVGVGSTTATLDLMGGVCPRAL
jgi:hypothetical protein